MAGQAVVEFDLVHFTTLNNFKTKWMNEFLIPFASENNTKFFNSIQYFSSVGALFGIIKTEKLVLIFGR